MCALFLAGPVSAEEAKSEAAGSSVADAGISPEDLEIIKDLEMYENWDDVQNEHVLETANEANTGDMYDQQG